MKGSDPPARAVVLAAGRGRRLRPYTDHTPKPLLPVNGRPLLDYTLRALAQAGVGRVCLVTHHLAEQIESYAGDGSRWGLAIVTRRQEEMLGTAHALQTAASFITAPAFVLAADYVLPPDYLYTLKVAYREAAVDLAVSLKELPAGQLSQRSSVRFDGHGRICEIVEKPAAGEAPSRFAASLIFIVPPAIRNYLRELHRSARGEYELQTVINQMLRDGYSIAACRQTAPAEWQMPRLE